MISEDGMLISEYDDWRRWLDEADWSYPARCHRKMYMPFTEDFMRECKDYVKWSKMWEPIKDINFIRENADRLNWCLLSKYYPFTKEQLKEFEDRIVWEYVANWNELDIEVIKEHYDKLDLEEVLGNWTIKLPKELEGKLRFFAYGFKDPYFYK